MTDYGQTSYIVILGWFKDLVRFLWFWPNFQGHHTIKTIKMSFVCILSSEPIGEFWPNLHRNTTGAWGRNNCILVTLTSFSRTHRHFECKILMKKTLSALYLLNQMMDSGQTYIMLDLLGDNSFLYWTMTCQGVCCKFTSMIVENNHFCSLPYIRVKFLYWSNLNIVSIVGIHVVLLCTLLKYWLFCIVK